MIEVAMSLLMLVLVVAVVGSLAYGALSAAPFLPLKQKDVARLIAFCQPKPGELLYDLGCGDGRILIAAVRDYKLRAKGFEVALVPYLMAKIRLFLSGVGPGAQVRLKNFWRLDLSPADIIVCFLTPGAMPKLAAKLHTELKPGARFASYAFPLPHQSAAAISKPLSTDVKISLYTKIVQPVI